MDYFEIMLGFKTCFILRLKGLIEMTAKSSKQQTEMLGSKLMESNPIKTSRHFGQGLL